ncbi:HTH domain-containing protein [Solidesulfovibrio magneticus]|uniref:Uncharacterized protein n=1 Tax=Solidesulfovibrio magneticus (strain ATCC 700980 / DSM 13731 / RS-1) TaxID=573370 RepID=C4XUN3_SOLM1|nr:HTH domain-containing protein [Solidesulfovibrio magneticus]BAH73484.1 hypothetical protein DMR_p2_00030 [Solidesulfovibrio magneticus RS-1]
MPELSWREACIRVLTDSDGALHCKDISDKIYIDGYKKQMGVKPSGLVYNTIYNSIKNDKENSPFIQVGKSMFALKTTKDESEDDSKSKRKKKETESAECLVKACGLFWQAKYVDWKSSPKLLGRESVGSECIDFSNQSGIYILYEHHAPIYVGRAAKCNLAKRISDHVRDKHAGRWDRFTWLGFLEVGSKGELSKSSKEVFNSESLILTVEAVLIETLEAPRNKRGGDGFDQIEYLQVLDPGLLDKRYFA